MLRPTPAVPRPTFVFFCCVLQTLAGTFSDKASLLVDLNERALAMRTGEQVALLCLGWRRKAT